MIKVKDGYAKLVWTTASGSASHILLSNGGVKAVSDFALKSELPDVSKYLPLTGGTLILENGDSFKIKRNKSNSYGSYIAYETNDGMLGRLGMYKENVEVYFGSQTDKSYNILHEGNFNSYAPKLDGTGASGTWNINISGDADTLDGEHGSWYQHHVHSFDIVNISVLYDTGASTNVNTLKYGMLYNYGSSGYWVNAPVGMLYGQILNLKNSNTYDLAGQLAWDINHNSTTDTTRYLWWRATDDGTWTEAKWHRIAYVEDIPTITDYYWANVKVSASSNTGTYPTFANMKSTGRVYLDEWIQFSGSSGLLWPNANGAHLQANTTTSFAGLLTQGARSGYCGLHCGPNTNYMTVMSTDVHHGLYCENTGTWEFYYNRSSGGVGIRTSSITKNFNVSGQSYLSSNVWIGTTSGGEMLNVGGWVGTVGNTGWYSVTHKGGWYMIDGSYVRTYNNVRVHTGSQLRDAFNSAGGYYSSWNNSVGNDWTSILNPANAVFSKDNQYVNHGTAQPMMTWANTVNSYGYVTRYSIGSVRPNNDAWGRLRLCVGNNDGGTSCGCYMDLGGDGAISTNASIYAAHFYENSDIRLKTNIENINNSDNIPQLKSFDWKDSNIRSYGLIAQELEEQGYSELVSEGDEGKKTVNYSAALSLIVGKLQVKIKELEKEIEILKNKN